MTKMTNSTEKVSTTKKTKRSFSLEDKKILQHCFVNVLPKDDSGWEDVCKALKYKFTVFELKAQAWKMRLEVKDIECSKSPAVIKAEKNLIKFFKGRKKTTPPKGTIKRASLDEDLFLIQSISNLVSVEENNSVDEDEDDELIHESCLCAPTPPSVMIQRDRKRLWMPEIVCEDQEDIGDDFSLPDRSREKKYRLTFIAAQYAKR